MRAIILAAGEGKRLRPYTDNVPKSLVKIGKFTMLEYQLELFNKNQIKSTVVAGYLNDKIKSIHNDVLINEQYATTNMLFTLFKAKDLFNEDIIISYGDITYTENTLTKLISDKNEISITIDQNWKEYWSSRYKNPLKDLETLVKKNNELIEIGNIPINYDKIQGQFMGLIKISKTSIQKFIDVYDDCRKLNKINNKDFKNAYTTDFLQELINRSIKVNTIDIYDPWIEIDSVDDYRNPETLKRLNIILNQ